MDLTRYGGLRSGLIEAGVVQEVDIKTGLVMFEWHAIGHVAIPGHLHARRRPAPAKAARLLPHLDFDRPARERRLPGLLAEHLGDLPDQLANGSIVWRLGGKKSSFALGAGVRFAWQHDAELLSSGVLTSVRQRGRTSPRRTQSRGVEIALDEAGPPGDARASAGLPRQADPLAEPGRRPTALGRELDSSTGSRSARRPSSPPTARSPSTCTWRRRPSTYRAFRYPWHGQPLRQPALRATSPSDGVTHLWASWNGATDVASWRVLAGTSRATLKLVATYPATGFETAIDAPTTAPVVRVQALSGAGHLLRSSRLVSTSP